MSDFSFTEFCERLARSKLMSAFSVQEAISQVRASGAGEMSAREFADRMVSLGKLSRFQADSLMQGFTRFFLDDFKLVDRVGIGRMAGVYRAVHKLGMPIAVKILPPNRAQKPDLLARFQREAKLAKLLNHPHIVKTYHSGCVDGVYYIAMEFLEGETLEDRLRDRKKLPPSEVIGLAEQALQALHHVYKKRLVHRDVKPGNFMLVPLPGTGDATTRPYTLKLLDVGLGRALFSEDDEKADIGPDLTKMGETIGTAAYTAPEQHANSHAADIRSDLYSLGCVLYECLAGQPPFVDRNPVQVVIKHATQTPPELVLEGYPQAQALQRWLWKLLAKKKNDRFRTPGDAARALRTLTQDRPQPSVQIPAPKIPLKRKTWEEASDKPEPERKPSWAYIGGGAGLGILCALLMFFIAMFHSSESEQSPDSSRSEERESRIAEQRPATPVVAESELADPMPAELDPAELTPARPDPMEPEPAEPEPRMQTAGRGRDKSAAPVPEEPGDGDKLPPRKKIEVARTAKPAKALTPANIAAKTSPGAYDPDPAEPASAGPRARWAAANSEFTLVSSPATPGIAYMLTRSGDNLQLVVEVECRPEETADLRVGLSTGKKQMIATQADAKRTRLPDAERFAFQLASSELVDRKADWDKLRMGMAAVWKNSGSGVERQRERLLHVDGRATHAEMSVRSEDWASFDLAAHERRTADAQQRLVVKLKLPQAGKTTVVIEDDKGRRVRNLIAAQRLEEGEHAIVWDGLDENRALVPAGDYRWRSISHDGIQPEYLFSFANGGCPTHESWGPNHTTYVAAAANKEFTFLGAPSTEGGHTLVAIDKRGVQVKAFQPADGHNHFSVLMAADDRSLYVLHSLAKDWQAHSNLDKAAAPNRKATEIITLTRFDTASGDCVPWGNERFLGVGEFDYGADSAVPQRKPGNELAGAVHFKGKLYLSLRGAGAVRIVDPVTGKIVRDFPVPDPGPICAGRDGLFIWSNQRIVRVDVESGALTVVAPIPVSKPAGFACDDEGDLYLSNLDTHQIHVFDSAGKPVRTIGKPGGPYAGAYDPQRYVKPAGIAVGPDGKLWVTEGRFTPKRFSACDRHTGRVLIETFGPQGYGGGGGGIDSADARRWILQGALWNLDFAGKKAAPSSILFNEGKSGPNGSAMHYRFVRHQGRTFVIGMGQMLKLSELMPDGRLRILAFVGGSHAMWLVTGKQLPAPFMEAWRRVMPANKDPVYSGSGVVWVDRNDDGEFQADEFDLAPEIDPLATCGWGQDQIDLTFRLTGVRDKRPVIVTLSPQGFHPSGAPIFPKLSQAAAKAAPVDFANTAGDSTVDRFGNVLLLTDPLRSIALDGTTRWTYPNQWRGVHGSHEAPLPERGVMQGALFFLGTAPLNERHDVFVVNGNHGRFFVMTGDGFYLDEMFRDVRTQNVGDEYLIGGECFGGFFTRGETDGQYYLQSGGRVYRIQGFDKLRRDEGRFSVSPAQLAAAQRAQLHGAGEELTKREAAIPFALQAPIPGNNWPVNPPPIQWSSVQVQLAHDGQHLFAGWLVRDESPWVNQGKDWQTLFKTGDSVDLQFGTDPRADPNRMEPVPGDLRLLIAPFQGQNVAVLYRHRVTRGPKKPAQFTSPWRSERVDDVRILNTAKIFVQNNTPGGYLVTVAIPLAELGLTRGSQEPYKADFGVIYGNPEGTANVQRSYWSNQVTGLVNDVPGEIMLTPKLWGQVRFETKEQPRR